ncbi:retinol-binding protein pinta-like [Arctopsyche grandis]|uniref:retinol-binding protein pinta-like n=1 Tax=Arctopsyche grandis TaxID=121162 RepID=UPI00406D9A4E
MGLRELSPELAKIAREELNEDPNRIGQDLQALKDWLAMQPHLNARTDDQWLIAFLRGCKHSLERSKEKLDMFYTLRTAAPEICQVKDPMDPKIQELLNIGAMLPLKKSSNYNGPQVIIVRPGLCDPNQFSILDSLKLNHMIFCILLMEDDQAVVAGQLHIADMTNVGMGHFTQMTPSIAKKVMMSGQDAMPFRLKGHHHFNSPQVLEKILNFFKNFVNENNQKRIFLHSGNIEAIYPFVPREILPAEYGGDAGPIDDLRDYWKKKLEDNRDWFLEEAKYKSDENIRLGKPKISEMLFGIAGSFRQLNVD